MDAVNVHVKWGERTRPRIVTRGAQRQGRACRQAPTISQYRTGAVLPRLRAGWVAAGNLPLNLRSTLDFPDVGAARRWPFTRLRRAITCRRDWRARSRTQPLVNLLISSPAYSEGWAVYAEDSRTSWGPTRPTSWRRSATCSRLFRARAWWHDTGIHSERWTRDQPSTTCQHDGDGAAGDRERGRPLYHLAGACDVLHGRTRNDPAPAPKRQDRVGAALRPQGFPRCTLGRRCVPCPCLEQDIARLGDLPQACRGARKPDRPCLRAKPCASQSSAKALLSREQPTQADANRPQSGERHAHTGAVGRAFIWGLMKRSRLYFGAATAALALSACSTPRANRWRRTAYRARKSRR